MLDLISAIQNRDVNKGLNFQIAGLKIIVMCKSTKKNEMHINAFMTYSTVEVGQEEEEE